MHSDKAKVQDLIRNGVPLAEAMDLRIDELSEGRASARIPFHARWLRPGGTLSGPVIMSLADAAMYAALLGSRSGAEMAVTRNLSIEFLDRPAQHDLVAVAEVLRMGRRLAYCEVSMYSAGLAHLVAHATGNYVLPDPAPRLAGSGASASDPPDPPDPPDPQNDRAATAAARKN